MALGEEVSYTLSLKDLLSAKLHGANEAAEQLEGTMGMIEGTLKTLGISFALFEGAEFFTNSIEKFHELEQATAKTEANLEATHGKAGVAMEDLKQWADELHSKTGETQAVLMDAQSQLLTFPAITKDNFKNAMAQVEDIAKQTHHGVSETAIMYGKALSNPAEGLQKLQRYGVILSDQEKKRIVDIQATSGAIAAQAAMMELINKSGYEGVAAAMFNADPMAKFKAEMNDVELKVGELGMKLLTHLAPAFEWLAHKVMAGVEYLERLGSWIEKHQEGIMNFAKGVLFVGAAWVAYNKSIALNLWLSKTFAGITSITEGALYLVGIAAVNASEGVDALTLAMDANPVGIMAVAVVALGAALYELYQHSDEFISTWKAFDPKLGNINKAEKDFNQLDWSIVILKGHINELGDSFTIMWAQAKGDAEGTAKAIAAYAKDSAEVENAYLKLGIMKYGNPASKYSATGGLLSGIIAKKQGNITDSTSDALAPKKASPNKAVNITVNINGNLVGEIKVMATTIEMGLDKIRQHVANTLLGATDDFTLVADR